MQTTHFSQLLGERAASRNWEAAFLGDADGGRGQRGTPCGCAFPGTRGQDSGPRPPASTRRLSPQGRSPDGEETKRHAGSWGKVFHAGDAAAASGTSGTASHLPGCRRKKLPCRPAYSQPKFHYANLI